MVHCDQARERSQPFPDDAPRLLEAALEQDTKEGDSRLTYSTGTTVRAAIAMPATSTPPGSTWGSSAAATGSA
jgi:hypothetical protein